MLSAADRQDLTLFGSATNAQPSLLRREDDAAPGSAGEERAAIRRAADEWTNSPRMTQAEYARAREISRQRVHQLIKDGRIALDGDGLVIVDQADHALATLLDYRKAHRDRQIAMQARGAVPNRAHDVEPSAVKACSVDRHGEAAEPTPVRAAAGKPDAQAAQADQPAADNTAADYWAHKARRERIEADRAELSLLKQQGELVDAAEVERSRRETNAKIATALMQIPARIAPVIAPHDPQLAEKTLRDEISRVLLEIAASIEAGTEGDRG